MLKYSKSYLYSLSYLYVSLYYVGNSICNILYTLLSLITLLVSLSLSGTLSSSLRIFDIFYCGCLRSAFIYVSNIKVMCFGRS